LNFAEVSEGSQKRESARPRPTTDVRPWLSLKERHIAHVRNHLRPLIDAVIAIAITNFAVFAAIAFFIGGDAISGHAADGTYYLASHSKLTAVSEGVFTYSRVHAISVFVMFGFALVSEAIRRYLRWQDKRSFDRSIEQTLEQMRQQE